jgi:ABC-2 type transport system permease protein
MSDIALTAREVGYANKIFWRNPPAVFFTFAFPLMFLVIFNLFGDEGRPATRTDVSGSTFYIPAIAAFSVITACYTNIAITLCFLRDGGVLKRMHGTPLPAWVYMAGRIVHAMAVGLLLVAITVAFGAVFYDVEVPTTTMPAFIAAVLVGAGAFSALGLAITPAVPNAEASPAVVNGIILPLLFVSEVFIPLTDPPPWLDTVTNFFPVRHLSEAMQVAFNPFTTGSGLRWEDLGIVALWGVAGAAIAARFFTWEPRR